MARFYNIYGLDPGVKLLMIFILYYGVDPDNNDVLVL